MNSGVGRWAPMVVVPAMVLAMAGCSGDDDDKKTDPEKGTDSPSATSTTSPSTITPQNLPTAPELTDGEGGVDDIDYDPSTCKTSAGTTKVSGTVKNPTKKATDYVIIISWTNGSSDTLALGFDAVQNVKPGATATWSLKAKVPSGVEQCVLNVRRGTIEK